MSSITREEINQQAISTEHLMGNINRRTAQGGIISIASKALQVIISLATIAALARLLTPDDFGVVAMALTVTTFASIFTDFGLTAATVQRKELTQAVVSILFYINVLIGCCIMLCTIATAPFAAWLFSDDRVLWIIVALSLPIPISAAAAQHQALLLRGMRWTVIQCTKVAAQLVGAITAVILAWQTDLAYWSLVAQASATAVVSLLVAWWACPWRPSWVSDWREARYAFDFGMKLSAVTLVNYFHRQSDDLLIGWRWGAADLGIYTQAYKVFMLPLSLINGPIGSAILPGLSRLQDQPTRWKALYLDGLSVVSIVSAVITAIMVASAEPIVTIVLGQGWQKAGEILQVLSISSFLSSPANTCGWIFISTGRIGRMVKWTFLATPIFVASFVVGVAYGPLGVAYAYLFAMVFIGPSYFLFSIKGTPLSHLDIIHAVLPPTIIGCLSAAVGLLIKSQIMSFSALSQLCVVFFAVALFYSALLLASSYYFRHLAIGRRRLSNLVRSSL